MVFLALTLQLGSIKPRPQAFMRYRVTEGGLEPNAILSEFPAELVG